MDIVERLRDLGDHASFEPHMHHEAADEIERLRQRDDFIDILDKQIITKDKEIDKLIDALWDVHSMCNNWPFVLSYKIKQYIRTAIAKATGGE